MENKIKNIKEMSLEENPKYFLDRVLNTKRPKKSKDVRFLFPKSRCIWFEVKAHKKLVIEASSIFEKMFEGKINNRYKVNITGVEPETFRELIKGIYCIRNIRPLTHNEALCLLEASVLYGFTRVRRRAMRWINYNIDNARDCHVMLDTALRYNIPESLYYCDKYFKGETYDMLLDMFHTKVFVDITDEKLSRLFALRNLTIFDEFELYQALELLVVTNRLNSYKETLKQIRFLTMTTEQVRTLKLLSDAEKYAIMGKIEELSPRKGIFRKLYHKIKLLIFGKIILPETVSKITTSRLAKIDEIQKEFQPDRITYWIQILDKHPDYELVSNRVFNLLNVFNSDDIKHLDIFFRARILAERSGRLCSLEKNILHELFPNRAMYELIKHSFWMKEFSYQHTFCNMLSCI